MAKKSVMVGPKDGQWQVKTAGASRAAAVVSTQAEAIERGREIAKNNRSELIIQGRNGQIRAKDSEGNDPRRSKG